MLIKVSRICSSIISGFVWNIEINACQSKMGMFAWIFWIMIEIPEWNSLPEIDDIAWRLYSRFKRLACQRCASYSSWILKEIFQIMDQSLSTGFPQWSCRSSRLPQTYLMLDKVQITEDILEIFHFFFHGFHLRMISKGFNLNILKKTISFT